MCCTGCCVDQGKFCGKDDEIENVNLLIDGTALLLDKNDLMSIYNETAIPNNSWHFSELREVFEKEELKSEGFYYQNLKTGLSCDCLDDFRYGNYYIFRFADSKSLPNSEILLYICSECKRWFIGIMPNDSVYPF